MHIDERLTDNVEINALRIDPQDGLEITAKDSGRTVRNSRVTDEPVRWEIAFPITDVENGDEDVLDANFESVRRMWRQTERGLHTFNFLCFVDGEVHKVRFDSELQTSAAASHLRKIESVVIREDD